jgi:hypothetical protein
MTTEVLLRRPAPGTPKPNGPRSGDNFSIVAEVGRTNSASNDRDEMEARLAGLSRASLLSIQKTSQSSSPSEKCSPQSQEASTASTAVGVPAGEGRGAVPPPPLLDDKRYSDPWRIDYAGMYLQDVHEMFEIQLTVLQNCSGSLFVTPFQVQQKRAEQRLASSNVGVGSSSYLPVQHAHGQSSIATRASFSDITTANRVISSRGVFSLDPDCAGALRIN